MPVYIVCYDLMNANRDQYEEITEAIKALSSHYWRFQDSAFFVVTSLDLGSLRNRLEAHLNTRDKLYVGVLEGSAAWSGYDPEDSRWMHQLHELAQQDQRNRAGYRTLI